MSSRHQSEEVRQIIRDIKECSPEELLSLHGVEIRDDGSVIDHTYDLTYGTVAEWLVVIDAANSDGFEKFTYDEEEY